MRRMLQKYGIWLLLTGIFLILIFCGIRMSDTPPFYFQLNCEGGPVKLCAHQAESGEWYVFLPSHGKLEDLTVCLPMGQSVAVNGEELSDGMSCEGFSLETDYPLTTGGKMSTLRFLKSANVASIYLETRSGTMDYIHEDKNNEEAVTLQLYDAAGKLNYTGDGGTIRGRGNATWTKEKKPYHLTLPAADGLLNMEESLDWILLSNSTDESNLHNRLVLDLAQALDMAWTPQYRYVDVYLNGAYNGLYLLTEKVAVDGGHLNLDMESGAFLCKIDLNDRMETLRNPFQTPAGRTVEISAPKELTQFQAADIEEQVCAMEAGILSGEDLSGILDLDSWICRYLIDEISGNIDSDIASSYFYYSGGKFFAGPVWDYDMTFGNRHRNEFPNAFIAKNPSKSAALHSPYYQALYGNPVFYSTMVKTYRARFLPILERWIETDISRCAAEISQAGRMNSLRWNAMFQDYYSCGELIRSDADSVVRYLKDRIAFLNRAWLEGVEYCTVQYELEPAGSYGSISVEKGSILDFHYLDTGTYLWYDARTGEPFDPAQPVTGDMVLQLTVPQKEVSQTDHEAPAVPQKVSFGTMEKLVLASLAVLIFLLCITMAVSLLRDRSTNKKKTTI